MVKKNQIIIPPSKVLRYGKVRTLFDKIVKTLVHEKVQYANSIAMQMKRSIIEMYDNKNLN